MTEAPEFKEREATVEILYRDNLREIHTGVTSLSGLSSLEGVISTSRGEVDLNMPAIKAIAVIFTEEA